MYTDYLVRIIKNVIKNKTRRARKECVRSKPPNILEFHLKYSQNTTKFNLYVQKVRFLGPEQTKYKMKTGFGKK